MSIEPGWYPDPVDAGRLRFWTGERWSEETRSVAGGVGAGAVVPVPTASFPSSPVDLAKTSPLPPAPSPPATAPPPSPWSAATSPPPPPPPRGTYAPTPRRVPKAGGSTGLVVALAVVSILILGVGAVVLVAATRSDDPERITDDDLAGEDQTVTEVDPGSTFDPAAEPGVAPSVACPQDDQRPEVRRVWQDAYGYHVVIVIATECAVAQVVADPQARFGLFFGDEHLVTGTFDLSRSPLALPAGGETGELELVFDAESDVNLTLREVVFVPTSEAASDPTGYDLRYVVTCEPGDGGGASASVGSDGGASLDGAPAVSSGGASPTAEPQPTPTDDQTALAVLEQIHAETAGERSALSGPWVPQVSAKSLDDDATYDVFTDQVIVHSAAVFLDRFRAWEARYGDAAVLVRGTDFRSICGDTPSPRCQGLWIVAIDAPSGSGEDVLRGWCASERLNEIGGVPITDTNQLNCFAKRYVDSDSPGTSFYGP